VTADPVKLARIEAVERATATYTHVGGTRACWACESEPETDPGEHDPDLGGIDQDGPFCVCGHSLEEVVPPAAA
jgi:hypothetical protein